MRPVFAFLVGFFLFTPISMAEDLTEALRGYKKGDGIDWARLKKDWAAQQAGKRNSKNKSVTLREPLPEADGAPIAPEQPKASTPSNGPTTTFLLRQNFSDIHLFDKPTAAADAKGAAFSWSDDRVADDQVWSVSGMIALAYSVPGRFSTGPGDVALMGLSFVPYAQLNRDSHSNVAKKNIDTQTAGMSLEAGFDADTAGRHYLRFSASNVNDRIKDANYFHSEAEWIPVYQFSQNYCVGESCGLIPLSILGAGPQIIYKLSPELKSQYDLALDDSKPVFFSNERDSLRIGPEVTLLMKLFGPDLAILNGLFDLSQFLAKATYHWDYETFSGREYSWIDTSLTYNIGKDGHLGLTASYQQGNDELSGQKTNATKLSLTGKF